MSIDKQLTDHEIATIPLGTNELPSMETHLERSYYKKYAYPENVYKPADFLYGNSPLYGRIDSNGNTITINPAKPNILKPLHYASQHIVALNFVTDAFHGFVDKYTNNKLNPDNNYLYDIKPRRALESHLTAGLIYNSLIEILYNSFFENYVGRQKFLDKKIIDIKSFLFYFINWIKPLAKTVPITKTGFIKSRYFNPLSTGLIIEVFAGDHSNDSVKYNYFIKDKNFRSYVNVAKQFGFLVDKNAPWRLIADLNSAELRKHCNNYFPSTRRPNDTPLEQWNPTPVAPQRVYNTYYNFSHLEDLGILMSMVYRFYASFIVVYPKTIKLSTKGTSSTTQACEKIRIPISREQFYRKYSMSFWIRLYLEIRLNEEKINLNKAKFNKIFKESVIIYNQMNINVAISLLNDRIKNIKRGGSTATGVGFEKFSILKNIPIAKASETINELTTNIFKNLSQGSTSGQAIGDTNY